MSISTEASNNGDCVLQSFISEILFCCGGNNIIKCARLDNNYNLKNNFKLDIPGENTYLNILKTGLSYTTIFYVNTQSSNEKTYAYYIYIPDCIDKTYSIIIYHSINEDKIENKESINNFFTRKANTKYYIEFQNIPEDYGNLILNNEIISFNTSKILINENNSNIFDFVSTNDKYINDYEILYNISIDETYSAQCKIKLTILPCYKSCKKCSKDDSSSNSEDHNCIENNCKSDYYTDPTKSTNCFMILEKKYNWYFDYVEMKFGICDEACMTCNGPSNKDCLTCYSPDINMNHSHYYNKECLNKCP